MCKNNTKNSLRKAVSGFILLTFLTGQVWPPSMAFAQSIPGLNLPVPGAMVGISPSYVPIAIKGLKIFPDNPFRFDFILDTGNSKFEGEKLKAESSLLIKYFLAALTIPDDDQWVNLSPYEKNRVIPHQFGITEMGRDLLAQDYLLKQLTASLIYPEHELGRKFWERVHKKAREKFGEMGIPVNTFNKVWIMPDHAKVYESGTMAFITESHLKVMLEDDYKNMSSLQKPGSMESQEMDFRFRDKAMAASGNDIGNQVIREVVLPEIEKEVNEGENFAKLRQIYQSMIMAAWFKRKLRNGLLGKIYIGANKVSGVDVEDKEIKQKIYDQYLAAFKKGVYNYIREDYDERTQETAPRKYFAGGIVGTAVASSTIVTLADSSAQLSQEVSSSTVGGLLTVRAGIDPATAASSTLRGPEAVKSQVSSSPIAQAARSIREDYVFWDSDGFQENQRIIANLFTKFKDHDLSLDFAKLINAPAGVDRTDLNEILKDDPVAIFDVMITDLMRTRKVSLELQELRGIRIVVIKDDQGKEIVSLRLADPQFKEARTWMEKQIEKQGSDFFQKDTRNLLRLLRMMLFDRLDASLNLKIKMSIVRALAKNDRTDEAQNEFLAAIGKEKKPIERDDLLRLAELILNIESQITSQRHHSFRPEFYLRWLDKNPDFLRSNHASFMRMGFFAKEYFQSLYASSEPDLLKPEFIEFYVKLAEKFSGKKEDGTRKPFYYLLRLQTGDGQHGSFARSKEAIDLLLAHQDLFLSLSLDIVTEFILSVYIFQEYLSFHRDDIPGGNPFASLEVLQQFHSLARNELDATAFLRLVFLHPAAPQLFSQLASLTSEERDEFVSYIYNDGFAPQNQALEDRLTDEEVQAIFSEQALRLYKTHGSAALPLIRNLRYFPSDLQFILDNENELIDVLGDLQRLGLSDEIFTLSLLTLRENRGVLLNVTTLRRLSTIGEESGADAVKFILSLIRYPPVDNKKAILSQAESLAKINKNVRSAYTNFCDSPRPAPAALWDSGTLEVVESINDPAVVTVLINRVTDDDNFRETVMAHPGGRQALIASLAVHSAAMTPAERMSSYSPNNEQMDAILSLVQEKSGDYLYKKDFKDDLMEAMVSNPDFIVYLTSAAGKEFFTALLNKSPLRAHAFVFYTAILHKDFKNFSALAENYKDILLNAGEDFIIILMDYLAWNPAMIGKLNIANLEKMYGKSSEMMEIYLRNAGSNQAFLSNQELFLKIISLLDQDIKNNVSLPKSNLRRELKRESRGFAVLVEPAVNNKAQGWQIAEFLTKICKVNPKNFDIFAAHEDIIARIHPQLLEIYDLEAGFGIFVENFDAHDFLTMLTGFSKPFAVAMILREVASFLRPGKGQTIPSPDNVAQAKFLVDWMQEPGVREMLDGVGEQPAYQIMHFMMDNQRPGSITSVVPLAMNAKLIRFLFFISAIDPTNGLLEKVLGILKNKRLKSDIIEKYLSREFLAAIQKLKLEMGNVISSLVLQEFFTQDSTDDLDDFLSGDFLARLKINAQMILGEGYRELLNDKNLYASFCDLINRPTQELQSGLATLRAWLGSEVFDPLVGNKDYYGSLVLWLKLVKNIEEEGLADKIQHQLAATGSAVRGGEFQSPRIQFLNLLATALPEFRRLVLEADYGAVQIWQENFNVFTNFSRVFATMDKITGTKGKETLKKFFTALLNNRLRYVAKEVETFVNSLRFSDILSSDQVINFLNNLIKRNIPISEQMKIMRTLGDLLALRKSLPNLDEIPRLFQELMSMAERAGFVPHGMTRQEFKRIQTTSYPQILKLFTEMLNSDLLTEENKGRVPTILENIQELEEIQSLRNDIAELIAETLARDRPDGDILKEKHALIVKALFSRFTGVQDISPSLIENASDLAKIITIINLYYSLDQHKAGSYSDRQKLRAKIKILFAEYVRTGESAAMDEMIQNFAENVEERKRLIENGYKEDNGKVIILDQGLQLNNIEVPYVQGEQRAKATKEAIERTAGPIIDLAKQLGFIPEGLTEAQRDALKFTSYEQVTTFVTSMRQRFPASDYTRAEEILTLVQKAEDEFRAAISKAGHETVRVEVAKNALEEATIGRMRESGCFADNDIHREMPLALAMESNAIIARIYDKDNNMIANVVLALTDKGVVVYKSYSKRADLNLDVAWFEAWKQLAQLVPAVILMDGSAGEKVAEKNPGIEKITNEQPFFATKRHTLWGKMYYDSGSKTNDSGDEKYDLTVGLQLRAENFPGVTLTLMERKKVVSSPLPVPVREELSKQEKQEITARLMKAADGKLDLAPWLKNGMLSDIILKEDTPVESAVMALSSRNGGVLPEDKARALREGLIGIVRDIRATFQSESKREEFNRQIEEKLKRTLTAKVINPQIGKGELLKLAREMAQLPAQEYGFSGSPAKESAEAEQIFESLSKPNGIAIVVRNAKGEVVGYILSRSFQDMDDHEMLEQELTPQDYQGSPAAHVLYIDDINLAPDYRSSLGVLRRIVKSLQTAVMDKKFEIILMHARVNNGLSQSLQSSRIGAKLLRTYPNWEAYIGSKAPQGEPADLLRIDIKVSSSSLESPYAGKNFDGKNKKDLGGIDMNSKALDLQTSGEEIKFNMPFDPAQLQNIKIDGFSPVILQIIPTNLPLFLGLKDTDQQLQVSRFN